MYSSGCGLNDVLRRPGARWPAAAVFDFDGLIADTSPCWSAAYRACLRRRGRELDPSVLPRLVGASVSMAARVLDLPPGELHEELRSALDERGINEMRGARRLIDALYDRLRMGIATNGPGDLVLLGLEKLQLADAFDSVVSAESVEHEKPAPDVYLAACRALRTDPSDAVALEDSEVGVEAASGAGMIVIYVPSDRARAIRADLRAPRLDDPLIFSYLGVAPPAPLTWDSCSRISDADHG